MSFANPQFQQYVTSGVNLGDVPCAPGKSVVGGGVKPSSANQLVNASYPSDGSGTGTPGQTGWSGVVKNTGTTPQTFTVYAICAS